MSTPKPTCTFPKWPHRVLLAGEIQRKGDKYKWAEKTVGDKWGPIPTSCIGKPNSNSDLFVTIRPLKGKPSAK